MKEQGTHEGCIEQMQRLFSSKLYGSAKVPVDCERLVRMDDWELDSATQQKVTQLMSSLNSDNFKQLADYAGYKQEFMQLNGFGFDNIDYTQPIDLKMFSEKDTE
jgi:enoyl-[acyl-carrier protein] reductase/trans-2-enoyl-CoA reductase (NAD+)